MDAIAINLDSSASPIVREVEQKSIFGRIGDKVKMKALECFQMASMAVASCTMISSLPSDTFSGVSFDPFLGVPFATSSGQGLQPALLGATAAVGLCAVSHVVDYVRKRLKNKMQRDSANANPDKVINDEIESSKEAIEVLKRDAQRESYDGKTNFKYDTERLDVATKAKEVLSRPEDKRIAARLLQKSKGMDAYSFGKKALMFVAMLNLSQAVAALPTAGMVVGGAALAYGAAQVVNFVVNKHKQKGYFNKLKEMISSKQKEK